ncbi:MAG: DUF554 domain-containing protein [candidate division Zixibacteria bacterium]|nr:DUF554 domain-containing protein [candidate division Zixibacteria bacterium]
MKGTLVNTGTVILGALVGMGVGSRLPDKVKQIVLYALGLSTILIGMKMALNGQRILIIITSLASGAIIGELIDIEQKLERLAEKIKAKIKSDSAHFVAGFVTASLVFCVGPMTIVGALEDGMNGDASVLYAKSVLDGFAALAFASGLGIGVLFSAVTVLVYQGLLTLLGQKLAFLLKPEVLNELSATGGLLIVGIGLLLLEIKKVRVANFLPALVLVVILASIF